MKVPVKSVSSKTTAQKALRSKKSACKKPAKQAASVKAKAIKKSPAKRVGVHAGIGGLQDAALRELRENGEKIAIALRAASVKGNVSSARLLLALAEVPAKAMEAPKKPVFSLASAVAAEPEWDGTAECL